MGKNYVTLLTLFAALLFIFSGCDQDELEKANGYGTIDLRLEANKSLIEMDSSTGTNTRSSEGSDSTSTSVNHLSNTRASEDAPDAGDFELSMYKNKIITKYWEKFSSFDPQTKFAIGEYELKATYGSIDNEGYYRPYYEGNTKLQIRDREKTEVELNCYLANVKVSVECSEAVKKYFTVFSMQARSDLGKLIDITKNETRSIYLKPGLLILSAQLEKQNGTTSKLELLRITDTEARQHYKIKVDVNQGNVGSGTLKVTYNTVKAEENVSIDLSDASLNIKQPVFTAQGFTNGASMTLREGAQPDAMKVTLNARAGIRSCDLIIDSPYLKTLFDFSTVDLASLEEKEVAKKQQLINKGLRLIGLNDEIDKLALIDFTPLVRNLLCTGDDDEMSSFRLFATDKGGREQESELSFNMTMQSNQFSFPEITDVVLIGSTEASAQIRLLAAEGSQSGQTDVENVIFEYQDETGNWKAAKTQWAGDDITDKVLHYAKIKNLPDVHTKLKIRARYGSKISNIRELGYYIPQFTLTAEEADIWPRKATLKVTAENDANLNAVLKYVKLTHNNSEIIVTQNKNTFLWVGLEPGKSYQIIANCNNEKTSEYNLNTELAQQLPNSNFESLISGPFDGVSINKGSSWAKRGAGMDWTGYTATKAYESTSMNVKVPNGWVTVNEKTMPALQGANANTWFVIPSTDIISTLNGSNSVRIRNVGWSNQGGEIQTLGSVGNFINKDLCYSSFPGYEKLNTPSSLYYSAGRLFLGNYSYNHSTNTETYIEGYSFVSRPTQFKFQYKYISKITDTRDVAYVKIVLKSGNDVLVQEYEELSHTTNVLTKTISFNYPANCKKATTISVMFCSSKSGIGLTQNEETNDISHYDIGTTEYKTQACVTGSELYIDNIELIY